MIPDSAAVSTTPGRLSDLFTGVPQAATPLIWLTYIASSMTVFSLSSWMPMAVEVVGLSRGSAALATSLLLAGSAVGGVVGGRFADRFGIAAVVAMAVLACPAAAAIGTLGGASFLLFPTVFLAGRFAFGANGVGWAIGIAKIGSMLGPYIAGLLIAGLTSQQLFMAVASPLLLVAALAFALRPVLANAAVMADRRAPVSAGWEMPMQDLNETSTTAAVLERVGQASLLSDALGVSMLVDAVNHRRPGNATETTVLGPFHVQQAPEHALGDDISGGMPGAPLLVEGTAFRADGTPAAGAVVGTWHTDGDGFYDVQGAAG